MESISQIKTERSLLKMNELVTLRNIMKKKKPDFFKQSSHKKKRLAKKWRKPRGSDSKIKVGKKGYPRKIKIGRHSTMENTSQNTKCCGRRIIG